MAIMAIMAMERTINSSSRIHYILQYMKDKATRVKYYREGFRQVLNVSLTNDLRAAVQTGTPLGNNKFKEEIEQLLCVKTGYSSRGRVKKVS